MEIFKKSDFEKLAKVHTPNCISIYMPTHRTNAEGNGVYKDKTTLKNQLKEVSNQLLTLGMKQSEIESYTKPLHELEENENFWRNQSDGLAIFYDGEDLITHQIPKTFSEYVYVNSHFYLKPMADLIHSSDRHFIMALSLGEVKFYEATQYSIVDVKISDLVPSSFKDVVGYDYEQKYLEARTGQGESGDADGMYHGHGSGNETEKKKEALKYFRAIDEGIMKMLHDENAPLVIACVDYLFPIYKEANNYNWLKDQHVKGNFQHEDVLKLKEKAWEIINPDFEKEKNEAISKYEALESNGKAAAAAEDVIPSAIIGRAESLFIKEDAELWGRYIEDTNKIEIHEVRTTGDASLINLAATETINHGGKVFILPEDQMPSSNSAVNAIYRYEM
ncbi:hypothetical protein E1176_19945 [Fulvivirga sp. RKSG066]|uniref:baeRF7 domain-containing protein n=1 Tax=Fulvivirga aurantia TaxID=2529383 RepID=UPI0012BC880D|nr:hypothetical protein [Fulvivirga aurantia]MTI23312.1 hypothetical protein [Fulvivirga aurantia]